MNNSSFEQLIKAYREVQMTSSEKKEVFQQSMLVIEKIEAVSLAHGDKKHLHTLLEDISGAEVQETEVHYSPKKKLVTSWFAYIRRRQFVPALIASFILLFFGTTSMLADKALPGDSLYSFKVGVNESVRDLTAVTDEAKARLAVEMTSRRLQEAAVLSAQGKLDEKSKQILQEQFVKKAGEVKNRVASLVSRNNLSAAQEVAVDFESALQTHELILATLSSDTVDTTPVDQSRVAISSQKSIETPDLVTVDSFPATPTPQVSTLLATVKSELSSIKSSRIDIQERVQATLVTTFPASSTPNSTQSASVLIESNVKEIKFTVQDIERDLSTFAFSQSAIDLAKTRLSDASSTIEAITLFSKEAKFADAALLVRKVTQNLSELETLLKLEKNSKQAGGHIVDFAAIISGSATTHASSATSTAPDSTVTPGQVQGQTPVQPAATP
jgi:hypothetical protein